MDKTDHMIAQVEKTVDEEGNGLDRNLDVDYDQEVDRMTKEVEHNVIVHDFEELARLLRE